MQDLNERQPDEAALRARAKALGDCMIPCGLKLACAESCTGGWLAKIITDIPGSSDWFSCSVVSYSNESKQSILDVPHRVLAEHGAVSGEAVLEMCNGLLRLTDADVVVSISGIAGPGGGSAEKPVGLVWLGWGKRGRSISTKSYQFDGDREAVRLQSLAQALDNLLGLAK